MNADTRRVLVVEDDGGTREFVAFLLRDAGHEVATAADGWTALAEADRVAPDLAILDLGLPGGPNGFEVARRLRARGDIGVIVLTGSDELTDEEQALDAGADDYVTKPVDAAILLARVRALLRRLHPAPGEVQRVGDLVVDDGLHVITSNGMPVDVTPTEFRILRVLARQPGRPVSKEQLVRDVWGSEYVGDGHDRRMVEVHVSRLRRKLESTGPRRIGTVRGAGYVLRG